MIGLAGGIASGKTSVAKRFEKLGAGHISTDNLGEPPGRTNSVTGCPQTALSLMDDLVMISEKSTIQREDLENWSALHNNIRDSDHELEVKQWTS